jgi:peptidyl-prolyl cis-trans isomerase SurA
MLLIYRKGSFILIKKWILGLILAISFIMLAACSDGDESSEEENAEADTQEETQDGEETAEQAEMPEMPEADLEGVPDVVAEVEGTEISKEDFEATYQGQFQQMAMQAQMTGEEVDQDLLKEQVAESMIGTELLILEANDREIGASDEEIEELIGELIENNGLESREALVEAFQEQGMDEEELMSQVETQVMLNKLVEEESADIEPTEEEMQDLYDQVVAQQEAATEDDEAEIPSFEELKPEIEAQIIAQKEGQAVQELVEELRENADVTIHL